MLAVIPALAALTLLPPEDLPPEPFLADEDPAKVELVAEVVEPPIEEAIGVFVDTVVTEAVIHKQQHLADLGWYQGEVDGIRGPLTEQAVEGFAEAAGVGSVTLAVLRSDDAPSAPPPPEPEPEVSSVSSSPLPSSRNVWDNLADCESGNWVNGGASFEKGSARWQWAKPGVGVPPWGTTIHHGGLQFHPGTWSAYKLDGYPQYAYDATREQQIAVAERVLADQGWNAWPTCSSLLGLR